MKKLLIILSIVILSVSAFAQGAKQNPLTQAEYVKLLYGLDANPASKEDLIQALRTRGIDFELNGGLRSLTISKSKNDAELRRTLEEANRRRENPTAAKLPGAAEASELLERTRQNTLAAVEEMPDFVVKQRIQRSAAYAGTNNFRSLDRLIVAVSYLAKGEEEYRVLSINGVRQDAPKAKRDYAEVQGTSSTGEFVTVLATIFKRENETKFEVVDTDQINGQRAIVYDFSIKKDKAQQRITAQQLITESTIAGMDGRIWIDRDKSRVLRIESNATEIPADFPIQTAKRIIDYDWVKINGEDYLLPSNSDVRLTFRQRKDIFETRNLIAFKDYKKYGSEVIILD
ncbi:MAG: hypothetical protein KDB79_16875, partial [Acidobacteria bacterium]|nr:hypothetical protein [Acidobacteriota bacterium]